MKNKNKNKAGKVQTKEKKSKQQLTEEVKQTGSIDSILDEMMGENTDSPAKKEKKKEQTEVEKKKKAEDMKKQKEDAEKKKYETMAKENEVFKKEEWNVYYSGINEDIPGKKATIDEIREFMETMYPELSEGRSTYKLNRKKQEIYFYAGEGKRG